MWPTVKAGDVVDVLAPSGKIPVEQLHNIKSFIESWGLVPRIPHNLLNDHPYLANSDEIRLNHLHDAIYSSDSKLIWCARGGHGTTRLMPELLKWSPPAQQKLLVGFSDITTLHIWLNQLWGWPSLHGPMIRQVAMNESHVDDVEKLRQILFHGLHNYIVDGLKPFNEHAGRLDFLRGEVVGTCLSLLAASLGTAWQIKTAGKILILEDINEYPYRLDRLFVHLANAGVFAEVKAVILGDFGGDTSKGIEADERVLEDVFLDWFPRHNIQIPIFRRVGIGHGLRNSPVPLGVVASVNKSGETYNLKFNM